MARLLAYFNKQEGERRVNVLVATSGDTGSAVANGFLDVPGVKVFVLYPQGKVSEIQEKQFTTLGRNITALEVSGTFDDCQALVKNAFMDKELNEKLYLTSANSINVARFLPQSFYYFYAYAQLCGLVGKPEEVVFSVPSGNFGNITAGLMAKRMGLPVKRFIAANNRNDVFLQYLRTGVYTPRPSVATIANAMDVGDPSNFARILDLYGGSHDAICAEVSGVSYTDEQIRRTMSETFRNIRTNIQFMLQNDRKVILVTSTVSGEGKSFTSANLAISLSLLGKKVVIVGLDIRKPGLNKVFSLSSKEKGITQYLSNPEMDLMSLVQPSDVNKNLFILPGGTVPPNPTELLARDGLDKAIDMLKNNFDYVILDTAPVGMVTDTLLIGRVADLSVYVCRADYTHKAEYTLINELAIEKKLSKLCTVINGVDLKKRKYGYYYGYGKYGKYYGYGKRYGYGYGYGEK